jgi:hypothetical protein
MLIKNNLGGNKNMKKLLGILNSITLITSAVTPITACGGNKKPQQKNR